MAERLVYPNQIHPLQFLIDRWLHHASIRRLGRFGEQAKLMIEVTCLPGTGTLIPEPIFRKTNREHGNELEI